MHIFGLTLITFSVVVAIIWIACITLDRTLFAPSSEEEALRRQVVGDSQIWWLTTMLFGGFAALTIFLISTAFATELYLGNMSTVMTYLGMVMPATVGTTLLFFFSGRWLLGFFLK